MRDNDHWELGLDRLLGWHRGHASIVEDLEETSSVLELEAKRHVNVTEAVNLKELQAVKLQQRALASSQPSSYLLLDVSNFGGMDSGGNVSLICAALVLVILLAFWACCCMKGRKKPGFRYYIDMAKLASTHYHELLNSRSDDGGKTARFPGPGSTSILTHEQVAAEMAAMPIKWANREIYRGNDLGFIRLTPYFWPDVPFAIGHTQETHVWLRPIMDQLLGKKGKWSADMIAASVREYLAYKKQQGTPFQIQKDINRWSQILLHSIHLDIKMTPEDAARFVDVQTNTLAGCVLPECLVTCCGCALKTGENLAYKEQRLDLYVKELRRKHPDMSDRDIRILASACLDSLMFAGGLSVAMVISCAMATIYSKNSPCKESLNPLEPDKIPLIVWETIRYYPAVVGFSWYDGPDMNERTVLSLASALKDPLVWGSDFDKFKLRDLATYHRLSVAWADKAIHPDRPQYNRVCPAKDLSLAMAIGFLEEWAKTQDSWSLPDDDIKIGPATPFTDGWQFVPK